MTRVFIAAGEPSGDLHAARYAQALRARIPDATFVGFGGPRMVEAGVELRANLVERAVMGVSKVIAEFGFVMDVAADFLYELEHDRPDVLVLVDYPGLNLNLARMAQDHGVPVVYFICPQVWAWAPWRMRRVASRVDLLLAILPFEEHLYRRVHSRVHYVGNPVFDHLSEIEANEPEPSPPVDGRYLAILPGSRRQEVEGALPSMLRIAASVAEAQALPIVVSCQRPSLRPRIDEICRESRVEVSVWDQPAHTLQRTAYLTLVVSGTATLEQAFFGGPMLVLYPAKPWQRGLFRYFSVTPFVCLVNLIAGREVVREFLFDEDDIPEITDFALALAEPEAREEAAETLRALRAERFEPGASDRAAEATVRFLEERRGATSAARPTGARENPIGSG